MNILIVAPHADDEILGCGGIISKYASQGDNVFVAIMTNAHKGAPELFSADIISTVRQEAKQAHTILGVQDTFFYEFPAPRLETEPSYKISIELDKLFRKLSADTIYLPHRGDIHKDHAVIFHAGLVAARPINNSPVKNIFCYETLSETEWAPPFGNEAFIPNLFEDITKYFTKKSDAMKCFNSQLKPFPHPRSIESLQNLAKYRGATVGLHLAEAFSVIRNIK